VRPKNGIFSTPLLFVEDRGKKQLMIIVTPQSNKHKNQ